MSKDHLEQRPKRDGFSIRDLLVVMAVVAVLLAFMPSYLGESREAARRMSCANNMKQLGLAIHNYHSAFKCLPNAMGGTTSPGGNAGRLNGLVALLPFIESSPLYETIANPLSANGINYPAFGPPPWDASYPPWQEQIPTFLCASDVNSQQSFARTNYVFCVGDLTTNLHNAKREQTRGMFAPNHVFRFQDVADGLSNTIMMTEIAKKRNVYLAGQFVINVPPSKLKVPKDCYQFVNPRSPLHYLPAAKLSGLGRGGIYVDGAGGYGLVHTILPPNGPSCSIGGAVAVDGIYSASSRHVGGCHALLGDGAVFFVANTIDTGDLTKQSPTNNGDSAGNPIPSPYGVWGALGTRAGSEGDVGFDY